MLASRTIGGLGSVYDSGARFIGFLRGVVSGGLFNFAQAGVLEGSRRTIWRRSDGRQTRGRGQVTPMDLPSLITLAVSALILSGVSAVGAATVLGHHVRLPHTIRTAIAPGHRLSGALRRAAYLAVSAAMGTVGQVLLIVWLFQGRRGPLEYGIVVGELAVASVGTLWLLRSGARGRNDSSR